MNEYYNSIYKDKVVCEAWENAPGKQVILDALKCYSSEDSSADKRIIVDMGCGTGYFLNKILSQISGIGGIGIDISRTAIENGRGRYRNLDLRQEDGTKTSIESNSVDYLVGYGCYEHFSNPDLGFKEAHRILRPSGKFFFMMPTLGIDRTDRDDEGWYEERPVESHGHQQLQWNLKRTTWEEKLNDAKLVLFDFFLPRNFGAIKPGVFFFGQPK